MNDEQISQYWLSKLESRYPYQFAWEPDDYLPPGWRPIFEQLCEHVDLVLPSFYKDDFRWTSMKEKFGQLRVYYTFVDVDGFDDLGRKRMAPTDVVHNAALRASITCQSCGKPGSLRRVGGGYLAVVCTDCEPQCGSDSS